MSDLTPRPRLKRTPPPVVFPPYAVRQGLTLLLSSPQLALAILPSPPSWLRPLKYLIYLLLLLNITSFPLLWHVKLFRPVLSTILKARPYLPLVRRSKEGETTSGKTGRRVRLEALPLGLDIFEEKVWMQERAWPGDCDYLLHLSNSSYLSRLDAARSALLFPFFFRLYTDGGRLHLGGSSLTHHREIPLMARYEVRVQVAAWDEKWFYLVARFTSPTKEGETHRSGRRGEEEPAGGAGARTPRSPGISLSRSARDLRELLRDVARPEHEAKAKAAAGTAGSSSSSSKGKRTSHHQSLSMSRTTSSTDPAPPTSSSTEPTLYATIVSRYCAKYSRKTIPPWLVVASSGFGTWASTRANWDKAEQCRARYASGAKRLNATGRKGGAGLRGKEHEAFLAAFDPSVAKGAAAAAASAAGPDSGSSSSTAPSAASGSQSNNDWMKATSWSLVEWEARRLKGLEEVAELGGLAPTMGGVPGTVRGDAGGGGSQSRRGTPSGGAGVGKGGYFE